MISFGRGFCGDYAQAGGREWLEADGRGGYAMGTVAGANTRRYHGLLTLPLRPPAGRFQAVNRLEEFLSFSGERRPLSCQAYPGAVHPDGSRHLESFRQDPFPVWTYAAADLRLEKSFFLRYGEATAVVLYELQSGPEVELEARPLFSGRDHHAVGREDGRFDGRWRATSGALRMDLAPEASLRVRAWGGQFQPDPVWVRRQEYAWEERRGLEHQEDVFGPGVFRFRLSPRNPSAALVFSMAETDPSQAPEWARRERRLRGELVERAPVKGPLAGALVAAADEFLVSRGEGVSVIAGYPWFEDWSRDALVSLPGLCLATGRLDDAEKLLDTYLSFLCGGLLPNRFSESGLPTDYNAADAPLWLIWAAQQYFKASRRDAPLRRWLPELRKILEAYEHGTLYGIHMDRDGLVAAPAGEWALTWMDARVDGRPVTPRGGKAVEIQALWYNALQFMAEMELKFRQEPRGYEKLASIARTSFNEKFWNEQDRYLYDRLDGREKDAAVRPNALLAASLPYEILEERRFKTVVDTAWRELYATYGLRTLSPRHPDYRARYDGPPHERDAAYHQGPAWTWLLGPFLTAFVKAYGESDKTKAQLTRFLEPFRDHLPEAGVGSVSELFEGDPPYAPRGCPAQAWSVAELLRVMWEENLSL